MTMKLDITSTVSTLKEIERVLWHVLLDREPVDIVATLLHETAHAWNSSKGIEDCASNQRHNKHFKEKAEALGLIVAMLGRNPQQNRDVLLGVVMKIVKAISQYERKN